MTRCYESTAPTRGKEVDFTIEPAGFAKTLASIEGTRQSRHPLTGLLRLRRAPNLHALCGLGILALVCSLSVSAAEDVQTLLDKGKYREAASAARAGLDEGPDTGHYWHMLGKTQAAIGQTSEALIAFKHCVRVRYGGFIVDRTGRGGRRRTFIRL